MSVLWGWDDATVAPAGTDPGELRLAQGLMDEFGFAADFALDVVRAVLHPEAAEERWVLVKDDRWHWHYEKDMT